ncbi:MAG TPA: hypothetical protein VF432_13570 [Thermoanaerobaculia bacterium]
MHDQLLTFDEFRTSHSDALCAQREGLRDDAAAEGILREGSASPGWIRWDDRVSVPQS